MASQTPPRMPSLQPLVDVSYDSFIHESVSGAASRDGTQYQLAMQHVDMTPFSPSFLDHELNLGGKRCVRSSPDGLRNSCSDAACEAESHLQCQTMASSQMFFADGAAAQHRLLFGAGPGQQLGFVNNSTTSSSSGGSATAGNSVLDCTHSFAPGLQRNVQYSQLLQQQQVQHALELGSSSGEGDVERMHGHSMLSGVECPEGLLQGVDGAGGTSESASAPSDDHIAHKKVDLPPPPKKPLSPYMRFSKAVWQQVKAVNPCKSVCEVGATIGRIWRELIDQDKQPYIDDFTTDKVRYDAELLEYMQKNGLQPSDLIKPRGKKKEAKDKSATPSRKSSQQRGEGVTLTATADPPSSAQVQHVGCSFLDPVSGGMVGGASGLGGEGQERLYEDPSGGGMLPSFSQVWSGQELSPSEQQQLLASQQQMMRAAAGCQQQQTPAGERDQRHNLPYSDQEQLLQLAMGQQQQQAGRHQCTTVDGSQSETAAVAVNGWMWPQFDADGSISHPPLVGEGAMDMLGYHSEGGAQEGQGHFKNSMLIKQENEEGAGDALEVGEVRLPQGINGQLDHGLYPNFAPQYNSHANHNAHNFSRNHNEEMVQFNGNGGVSLSNRNGTCAPMSSVDTEKMLLRNHLVEKSQEILKLMKELEQAYALIHQLKQQNDFFHQQWTLQQQQVLPPNSPSTAPSIATSNGNT